MKELCEDCGDFRNRKTLLQVRLFHLRTENRSFSQSLCRKMPVARTCPELRGVSHKASASGISGHGVCLVVLRLSNATGDYQCRLGFSASVAGTMGCCKCNFLLLTGGKIVVSPGKGGVIVPIGD